jgi:putative cell wall-binding protein
MTNAHRLHRGSASRVLAVGAALAMMFAMVALSNGTASAQHREPQRFEGINNLTDADSNAEAATYWSQEQFQNNATSDTVLLGRDDEFADSLSSGGLQCEEDAPLLLTDTDALTDITRDEMERLDANSVTILGGPTAVSEDVEQELTDEGFTVDRVSGTTRVETAIDIADTFFADADTAIVARAYGDESDPTRAFADALAAGAAACEDDIPVLLTQTEELNENLEAYLTSSGMENVIIVGGTGAVSQTTEDDIEALGIDTERVSGTNRAATAVEIADRFFPDPQGVTLVDGFQDNSWASGFPAARFSAVNDSPILLTGGEGDECVIPQETRDYLADLENRDIVITLGPFTDNCVEEFAAEEFGRAAVSPSPGDGTTSPDPTEPGILPNVDVTECPELITARVVSIDDDNDRSVVEFDFDEDVNANAINAQDFFVITFNSLRIRGTEARVSSDDSSVVRVLFNTADDVRRSTMATVDHGAVQDNEGNLNPEGDAGLQSVNVEPSITEAPDLVDLEFDNDENVVDFVFDEELVLATSSATGGDISTNFQLVLVDGTILRGETADREEDVEQGGRDNVVEVTFTFTDSTTGTTSELDEQEEFDRVARGVVLEDTVMEEEAIEFNPLQAIEERNAGNADTPSLVSATLDIEEDEVEFVFSESVTVASAGAFAVYDTESEEFDGEELVSGGDGTSNRVEIRFEEGVLDEAIVGANVDEGAVTETGTDDTGGRENAADEVGVSSITFQPGETVAPDLIDVRREETFDEFGETEGFVVVYVFDEEIEDVDDDRFFLTTEDCRRFMSTDAQFDASGNSPEVRVTFDITQEEFDGVTLASVDDGAVSDDNVGERGPDENHEASEPLEGGGSE